MISESELKKVKSKFGDIFDIDDSTGNMKLKNHDKLPPFELIFVEGGEFVMGNDEYSDNPQHKVKVSSYYIAKYPVTQSLYKAVVDEKPSNFEGDQRPVEQVRWYDAMDFCRTLNKMLYLQEPTIGQKDNIGINEGATGFRLPSEAEWEYAAGGGNAKENNRYAGSDDLDMVGWYYKNNEYETKPVGLKLPNQLGIYDMSGNVWEWCMDWFDKEFFKKNNGVNPINLENGSFRVLRGGSWSGYSDYCVLAYRNYNYPGYRWDNNGFRLLLTCF